MKMYWNLRKCDSSFIAAHLRSEIPELKNVDIWKLENVINNLPIEFYKEDSVVTKWYIRLTLPVALLVMLLMLIFCPIKYIFTGSYGYKILFVRNWIKALGL